MPNTFTNIVVHDRINNGRQFEIDLAKALAIVWMILVHVSERYFPDDTPFSPGFEVWTWSLIEFAGGPLGAPVFMIALGIGLVYSKNQDAGTTARRGVHIFGQGYVLNILRLTIPFLVLFFLTGEKDYLKTSFVMAYVLDILQFAGLVFLFFGLVRYLRVPDSVVAAAAAACLVVGSVAKPLYPESNFWETLLGLLWFQNRLTTFPFFNWLAYPAAGYLFGKILQRVADKRRFYALMLAAGTLLLAAYTAALSACGYDPTTIFFSELYYRQDVVKVAWILLTCCIWFGLLYFVSLRIRDGRLKNLILHMSKKLNDIYIYQWILIGWVTTLFVREVPVYGFEFWLIFVLISVVSVLLTYRRKRVGE